MQSGPASTSSGIDLTIHGVIARCGTLGCGASRACAPAAADEHPITQSNDMNTSRYDFWRAPAQPVYRRAKGSEGRVYSTDKDSLLETAKANGADEDVLRRLQDLPDPQYQSPAEVSKCIDNE
jgi:hypothetical protein